MRKVMVIPTYWARPLGQPWQEGDAVYDHPTAIDGPETLTRTLESMRILEDRDFKLVILVCPVAPELEQAATKRVEEVIRAVNLPIETYVFTPTDLKRIAALYSETDGRKDALELFSLRGYSNVRNMCLLCGVVLTADAVLLIDDDEIFELPDYVSRATEFIGKRVYGDTVHAIAGYYLNKDGQYYDDVEQQSWMAYWDRFKQKANAFDKYIGTSPRLKRTPFAFGGAMVLQKNLFTCVPFDPAITRGEDIDYVINSRMYGFSFFLDNTLSIKHLPEPKKHPAWRSLREDIYRFVYEKAKIEGQFASSNMLPVTAEEFEPYPGNFLKEGLEDKIFRANVMLAVEEMVKGDIEASNEALQNIHIAMNDAKPTYNPFIRYREVQKKWEAIVNFVAKNRYAARTVMEDHNLSKVTIVRDENHVRSLAPGEMEKITQSMVGLIGLTKKDLEYMAEVAQVKTYYEGEAVFQRGETNDSFCFIIKGAIRLFAGGGVDGVQEFDIVSLHAGDVLGESSLMHTTFSINGTASEFTEVFVIDRVDLRKLIHSHPSLGVKLLEFLLAKSATKLDNANKNLVSYVEKNPPILGAFIEDLQIGEE